MTPPDIAPADPVMYCPVEAVSLIATAVSAATKLGVIDPHVESVAVPLAEPSFVQLLPEIFEAIAVNENCGVGAAASAGVVPVNEKPNIQRMAKLLARSVDLIPTPPY